MISAGKPRWQQLTALVSLSAGGVITGFSFVPGTPNDLTGPAAVPVHLLALKQSVQQSPADDAMLRSAIVNVAQYYLRMARHRTSAEMQAIIWQNDSVDGADHGASCAAFASLTLELAAQVVGKHSWVTGGTSYPWPLYKWADVRVDRNPASPGIVSIRQDAQAHQRWHPLAGGYQPRPGDWVAFHGHVEVVTSYAGGVLHTIGADSLPDFSVNAHEYSGPLAGQGIVGFVNNGHLPGGAGQTPAGGGTALPGGQQRNRGHVPHGDQARPGDQHRPGDQARPADQHRPGDQARPADQHRPGDQARPGDHAARGHAARGDAAGAMAAIPGASSAHEPGPPPARQHGDAAIPGPAFGTRRDRQPVRHPHEPGRGLALRRNEHLARGQPTKTSRGETPGPAHGGQATIAGATAGGDVAIGPDAADGAAAIPGVPAKPHRLSPPSAAAPTPPGRSHAPSAATAPLTRASADPAPASPSPSDPARADPAPARSQPANGAPADATPANAAPAGSAAAGAAPVQASAAEQAFIGRVAPGAMAAQRKYGVPASVTIAQAINESGWGRSALATKDHNLFGIKGTGPSGSDALPTYEYSNGQPQPRSASFRVYRNTTQSIDDHGKLLATSGYYQRSMAQRHNPDAFASSLTGVYATDPEYGAKLIHLMRRYDLYRYDNLSSAAAEPAVPGVSGETAATPPAAPTAAPVPPAAPSSAASPGQPQPAPAPAAPAPTPTPTAAPTPAPAPTRSVSPVTGSESPAPQPAHSEPTSHARPSQPADPAPGGRSHPFRPADPAPGSHARTLNRPDPMPSTQTASYQRMQAPAAANRRMQAPAGANRRMQAPGKPAPRIATRTARARKIRYQEDIPPSVRHAFLSVARAPLRRAEPLYQDVASYTGIRWELLAACDWMQCEARKRHSPVHGEKLGTLNPDGTVYRTKSAALERCADDLVDLARAVYGIDLTAPGYLTVRDLANVFAAFRWGGLLRLHHTSAMEFPYSVAGLTDQHMNMRWPDIADPNSPDKPGARFRMPFGAVPTVVLLNYPATA